MNIAEKKTKAALLVAASGIWLVATSLTFNGLKGPLFTSDLLSGFLLLVLGLFFLKFNLQWLGWTIGVVGAWLQIAPIAFWAPSAALYLNDTVVGVVAIVFAFVLTKKENVEVLKKEFAPQGWSYNPSSWGHRIPTVGLALLCWLFSRYMAAFQLGYIDHIWDPFFQSGTLDVITSKISKSFPVSDAGLGAVCYTLEFLLGWQGDEGRWYKKPWLVLAFGILVVPVGIVSIILIILQPVAVGAWCSWCIGTAICMLTMIILTAGELIAVLQFLKKSTRGKRSFWQVLWKGSNLSSSFEPAKRSKSFSLGITVPWNLLLSALLGLWLIVSTSLFYTEKTLSIVNYTQGPLLIALSILSMAEVFRSARYLNILFSIVIMVIPTLFSDTSMSLNLNNVGIGIAVFALAFPRGRVKEKYGEWDNLIF